MTDNTTLLYPNPDQCPCCGRDNLPLIARLVDDTQNTHTTGTVSGSGVGFGGGHMGVGVGFARVNLDSTTQTRLQANSERLALAEPNKTNSTIKMVIFAIFVIGAVSLMPMMIGMFASPPEVAQASQDPMTKASGELGNMLPMFMILPTLAMIAFGLSKLVSLPKAQADDDKQKQDNQRLASHLEQYYRTLRYCEHDHVIFDKAGYSAFAERGAVEKLSRNAGVFEFKPIETNRVVNQSL